MNGDYPATVAEILDDSLTFNPDALRAVRAFARSKPWRGTVEERQQKFRELNTALSAAYGIPAPTLVFAGSGEGDSGSSSYTPATNSIRLTALSTVTMMHEFCHARGMGEGGATRWSVNIFKRIWPRSFANCVQIGHMLRRRDDLSNS